MEKYRQYNQIHLEIQTRNRSFVDEKKSIADKRQTQIKIRPKNQPFLKRLKETINRNKKPRRQNPDRKHQPLTPQPSTDRSKVQSRRRSQREGTRRREHYKYIYRQKHKKRGTTINQIFNCECPEVGIYLYKYKEKKMRSHGL